MHLRFTIHSTKQSWTVKQSDSALGQQSNTHIQTLAPPLADPGQLPNDPVPQFPSS
jgi:hypothetical protein